MLCIYVCIISYELVLIGRKEVKEGAASSICSLTIYLRRSTSFITPWYVRSSLIM